MKRIILFIILSVLLVLSLAACDGGEEGNGDGIFWAEFLSTGKSDCAIVYMDGLVIVSDAADADDYGRISSFLSENGIEKIDYLILSHYDKDHIGSAAALIENYLVGTVIRPSYTEESEEYSALIAALSGSSAKDVVLTSARTVYTGHGSVTVDPPGEDFGDDNNNSIITAITFNGERLLFMGDAKKKRTEEFLDGFAGPCALIKLPHHGDGNSALSELIEKARPAYAVVTVTQETEVDPDLADKLAETGCVLFRTDAGAIRAEYTDGAVAVFRDDSVK